jgi:hypothetical protein
VPTYCECQEGNREGNLRSHWLSLWQIIVTLKDCTRSRGVSKDLNRKAEKQRKKKCILYNLTPSRSTYKAILCSHGHPLLRHLLLFLSLGSCGLCGLFDWYVWHSHTFSLRCDGYIGLPINSRPNSCMKQPTIASRCKASSSACTASSSSGLIRDCNVSSISYLISSLFRRRTGHTL